MKMLSCKNSLHVSRNRISWAKKVHCLLLIEQKYEAHSSHKNQHLASATICVTNLLKNMQNFGKCDITFPLCTTDFYLFLLFLYYYIFFCIVWLECF